ncbi:GNAT family N-acetyltransferase [Rhodobacterales bacterium HKCCE3408]|nr:GNAT family N-acetyltransferase [Rhodobacterales bacterium HKCCE3408]
MTRPDIVPTLFTNRLCLRGHRLDDFPDSAAMWADPEVVAYISGKPSSEEQSWSRILRYTGHWHHTGFGYWVVVARDDGIFLGEVGFADYRRETTPSLAGKPEAGWVFSKAAHGHGYATEAVGAMLRWADSHLKHPKTAAIFDPAHTSSINVARKTGFSGESIGRYGARETLFMERNRQPR